MAEDIGDKIVNRLTAEGQLTRNSGTNSIKTLRADFAKFDAIFRSIDSNIKEQTQLLAETLQLQLDEAGRAERARQIEEARKSSTTRENENTPQAVAGAGVGGPSQEEARAGAVLGTGLGGLFGLGGATAGISAGLMAALKKPIRTALIGVLAPAVGTLIGNFAEDGLKELGMEEGLAKQFGEAAEFAGLAGMLGLAFGKKLGLVAAAGGAAASFGDDVLNALGIDKDSMIKAFGVEMKAETAAQSVMGALGSGVTAAVMSPAFRSSITNFFKDSVDADGNPLSRFPRRRALIGGTIALSVLGAYLSYGEEAGEWLEKQGLPPGFADTTVDAVGLAATGASLGMMFGPYGAIVGATLGFAVGLGKNVLDWMKGVRDKASAAFKEEAQAVQGIISKAAEGQALSEDETRELARVRSEAQRRMQLALPGEDSAYAKEIYEQTTQALSRTPLSASGASGAQIGDRVRRALSGDKEAFNELMDFANQREREPADVRRMMEGMINDAGVDYITNNPQAFNLWEEMVDTAIKVDQALSNLPKNRATPLGKSTQSVEELMAATSAYIQGVEDGAKINYNPINISPMTNFDVNKGPVNNTYNGFGGGSSPEVDALSIPGGVQ